MVHQHFMLVPSQTVTENILLGLDDPSFFMRLNEYDAKIAKMGEQFGLKVDPRAKIWQLSVGEQQRVELLKMLYRGVNVLIMDEPTAVLAPQEIEGLFETLRASNLRLWAQTPVADRERFGRHRERGPESYGLIVRLGAGHDRFHLAQAERALAAVRGG